MAQPLTQASGCRPLAAARRSLITSTAAAPSLSFEALPAVTVPSRANAGRRPARASRLVSGRGDSSPLNSTAGPLRGATGTATISRPKRSSRSAAW